MLKNIGYTILGALVLALFMFGMMILSRLDLLMKFFALLALIYLAINMGNIVKLVVKDVKKEMEWNRKFKADKKRREERMARRAIEDEKRRLMNQAKLSGSGIKLVKIEDKQNQEDI